MQILQAICDSPGLKMIYYRPIFVVRTSSKSIIQFEVQGTKALGDPISTFFRLKCRVHWQVFYRVRRSSRVGAGWSLSHKMGHAKNWLPRSNASFTNHVDNIRTSSL